MSNEAASKGHKVPEYLLKTMLRQHIANRVAQFGFTAQ